MRSPVEHSTALYNNNCQRTAESDDQAVTPKEPIGLLARVAENGQVVNQAVPGAYDDQDNNDDHVPGWPALLYDYTQNATLHGVRYITEEGTYLLRKIIWFLLFSGAFGFFIYYAYGRISFFLQFTKNVNVEVNYLPKVKFPAVTFCNQNTFRLTAAADNNWYSLVKALANNSTTASKKDSCGAKEILCNDQKKCVLKSQVCDLFPDCDDNSDEKNCDVCPYLLLNASAALTSKLPDVFGHHYQRQQHSFLTSNAFFAKAGNGTPYYIYNTGSEWIVSQIFPDSTKVAFVLSHNASSPDRVTSQWKVTIGGVVTPEDVNVSCEYKNLELLPKSSTADYGGINLDTLFYKTAHQREVFIEDCM